MDLSKIFWNFALILVAGNAIGSLALGNIDAALGWVVALCWFPDQKIRGKR